MTAKYRVVRDSLTLDELDEINELVLAGKARQIVATAYVAIRASEPGITLDDVRRMKQGDVEVLESEPDGEADPTTGP